MKRPRLPLELLAVLIISSTACGSAPATEVATESRGNRVFEPSTKKNGKRYLVAPGRQEVTYDDDNGGHDVDGGGQQGMSGVKGNTAGEQQPIFVLPFLVESVCVEWLAHFFFPGKERNDLTLLVYYKSIYCTFLLL